jgi:dTDP-4-amino-4,6-dideoxygalactose transaminase
MVTMKALPRNSVTLSLSESLAAASALLASLKGSGGIREEFEQAFAAYIGVAYAVSLPLERQGLFLALQALGLDRGSEILLPAYTFYALPVVIRLCGLVPVFVDAEFDSCNIDTGAIEASLSSRTSAVLVSHLHGKPCNLGRIRSICSSRGLALIEDCAHATGAEYGGQKVGSLGDVGCFSFGLSKPLTAFGGGMLTTNNTSVYDFVRSRIDTYREPGFLSDSKTFVKGNLAALLSRPGLYSCTAYPLQFVLNSWFPDLVERLTDEKVHVPTRISADDEIKLGIVQAAVGLGRLKHIERDTEIRIRNSRLLMQFVQGNDDGNLPKEDEGERHAFLNFVIKNRRRRFLRQALIRSGIDSCIPNLMNCAGIADFGRPEQYPIAENLTAQSLQLPNHPLADELDIERIGKAVNQFINSV